MANSITVKCLAMIHLHPNVDLSSRFQFRWPNPLFQQMVPLASPILNSDQAILSAVSFMCRKVPPMQSLPCDPSHRLKLALHASCSIFSNLCHKRIKRKSTHTPSSWALDRLVTPIRKIKSLLCDFQCEVV